MDEEIIVNKLAHEYPLRECTCGKKFVTTSEWVYKITTYKNRTNKVKYYCSYTCWRKAGGGNTKRKSIYVRDIR